MSPESIELALPNGFEFYHLGKVEAAPEGLELPEMDEDSVGVAFSFQGDRSGVILAIFDRGLDLSMYTEMGNVIASRIVTSLGEDAVLSPPNPLSHSQLERLLRAQRPVANRTYFHVPKSSSNPQAAVPVHALVLLAPEGSDRRSRA